MHRVTASKLLALTTLGLVALALVIESLTHAFVGDEAFHLLAARLIVAGRTPYADFFYQHPPLFVYLIAGIFRISGVGWRVVHVFSTASVIGAIVLAALYARNIFAREDLGWRNATLIPLLLGLNCYVLVFATTGLPFGFCLFCLTASLNLSRSTTKVGLYLSGCFAGAAATASFLTLPALPVFAVWLVRRERRKAFWFVIGVTTAFIPLLLLLVVAPERTVLDVVKYHLIDRPRLGWRYDLGEIAGWMVTLQGMTLLLLAFGAVRLRQNDDVRMCAWLALVLIASIGMVRTTFSFYFLLVTPFLAILAATGVTELTQRFRRLSRLLPTLVVAAYLVGLQGLKYVWRWEAPYTDHHDVEQVVKEVESCAPTGNYYALEAVYFLARRLPPSGMENRFDPNAAGDRALQQGRFDAVVIGPDNPRIDVFRLYTRYARRKLLHFDGYSLVLLCERTSLSVNETGTW